METQIMLLDVINPYVLFGMGIVLIALEAFIVSFILIWFGIGFLIAAIISYFYDYGDGIWQLGTVAIISLLLITILRKRAIEKFLKSEDEINDNYLDEKGVGEIKNSKVFYKGTYWEVEFADEEFELEDNQKVEVLKTYKNSALIQKR
ncbi:nodulation efficiency protein D [Halarcobacter ebronensis]|uniref:Nodulation efficiency protein D n=1 Tax=Halarcobacter ebronensis TaxID=1462615 RepID=A0A4Q0YJR0_9BACT|nr:nodulation efficiency protein D [Halarcobacter ebronensis]RXJ70114.1 nodulation efficiency protein D [Halarcobacter ebronensis]